MSCGWRMSPTNKRKYPYNGGRERRLSLFNMKHIVAITNTDNTNQSQSACTFDKPPCAKMLQRLSNITGRQVKHQAFSEAGRIRERYYNPAGDEDYEGNQCILKAVVSFTGQ